VKEEFVVNQEKSSCKSLNNRFYLRV